MANPPLDRTQPIYRRSEPGVPIVLYQGALAIGVDAVVHIIDGEIHLEDGTAGPLVAIVEGNEPWMVNGAFGATEPAVELVEPFSLNPPAEHIEKSGETSGLSVTWPIHLHQHIEGSLDQVSCIVVHIDGTLDRLPIQTINTERVAAADFQVTGWNCRLVKISNALEGDFTHIVNCAPTDQHVVESDVEELRWRLHIMFALIAGQTVNVGAVAGLDAAGDVVWVQWLTGRQRTGEPPGARWCSEPITAAAIPTIARGFQALHDNDPALLKAVDRAINYATSASGGHEVLDIRVPVACIGLETLGWAVLQRRGWAGTDALNKMSEGSVARIFLKACEIPIDIPPHFEHLVKRWKAVSQPDWTGPELLFKIRNDLVHPPKKVDALEWPNSGELREAWLLGTWYLELAILHTLGYNGDYWSRLVIGRGEWETEPVPWAPH